MRRHLGKIFTVLAPAVFIFFIGCGEESPEPDQSAIKKLQEQERQRVEQQIQALNNSLVALGSQVQSQLTSGCPGIGGVPEVLNAYNGVRALMPSVHPVVFNQAMNYAHWLFQHHFHQIANSVSFFGNQILPGAIQCARAGFNLFSGPALGAGVGHLLPNPGLLNHLAGGVIPPGLHHPDWRGPAGLAGGPILGGGFPGGGPIFQGHLPPPGFPLNQLAIY